jgi:trehalose 6-phosphate phosphatase
VSTALTLAEALEPLRADPARAGILLDVDGTLAPIVRHADDAHVPEPTRVLLIQVARRYGLIGCISGRQATTARRIVSIGSIAYIGNHGAELLRPGGTEVELDPDFERGAEKVRAFAERHSSAQLRRLRVRGEDKGGIQAFHWRGAPDESRAEEAVREIAEAAEQDGLIAHWGRKVLEIRPAVQIDKGGGVRRLIEDMPDIATALYVGDDTTDLDAFRALRGLVEEGRLTYALCLGVRSDETPPALEQEVDLLLDGPAGVRQLLEALL